MRPRACANMTACSAKRSISQPVPACGLPAQIVRQSLGGSPGQRVLAMPATPAPGRPPAPELKVGPAATGRGPPSSNPEIIVPDACPKRRRRCPEPTLPGQSLHIQILALRVLASLHMTRLNHQPHESSQRAYARLVHQSPRACLLNFGVVVRDDRRVVEGIIYRYRCGIALYDVGTGS